MTARLSVQDTVFHGQKFPIRPRISVLGGRPPWRGVRCGRRAVSRFQAATGRPDGGGGKTVRGAGMTACSDSKTVAGGKPAADRPARHIPVLARGATGWLGIKSDGLYIDATFG